MNPTIEIFGADAGRRSWWSGLVRGMGGKCPECGRGRIFAGYLKVNHACPSCGTDLSGHRADDAPPYITIFIVGHVVAPLALVMRQAFYAPVPMQFAVLIPLAAVMMAVLLPASKGAMIGLQWANRMHGFAGPDADPSADA